MLLVDLLSYIIQIFQKEALNLNLKRLSGVTYKKMNDINNDHRFIFVYATYSDRIDRFSHDYISCMRKHGGYIIYVTNNVNFDEQVIDLSGVDVFIRSHGHGLDFGQYQIATKYIVNNIGENVPEKIIYSNDSVFFFDQGNYDFLDKLLDSDYDFVGPFEVSGLGIHSPWQVAAWLFSVSKALFYSDQFQNFWSNYIPITNKIHAIRNGEHKLTKAALSFSGKVNIIYDNDYLIELFGNYVEKNCAENVVNLISSLLIRNYESKFIFDENIVNYSNLTYYIKHNLFIYPPSHMFALFLLKEESFPFLKKDIFLFNFVTYDKLPVLEEILCEILGDDAAKEVIRYYLKRGRATEAPLKKRLLIRLGLHK